MSLKSWMRVQGSVSMESDFPRRRASRECSPHAPREDSRLAERDDYTAAAKALPRLSNATWPVPRSLFTGLVLCTVLLTLCVCPHLPAQTPPPTPTEGARSRGHDNSPQP